MGRRGRLLGTSRALRAELLREGLAVYGTSGIFMEHGENRMHGRDERVPVKSFFEGADYLDRLVRELAAGR